MWRSRVVAARRACSLSRHPTGSKSPSISSFPISSQVHIQLPSQCFTSKTPFPQNPRFFSQESSHDISLDNGTEESDPFTDNNNVFDENPSFNLAEEWEKEDPFPLENNSESVDEMTAQEVDLEQLESVLSLLQSRDSDSVRGWSLESSLESMNLTLSEEFVVRVLETPLVPSENLVLFFKWAAFSKNQSEFYVTTRSLHALVRVVSVELRKKVAYGLWDLVKELGEKKNDVVTTEILNGLISLFSRLGKGMAGYEVFSKFEDFLCVTNADSYYFTIEALCRRKMFDKVGFVCENMLSEGKLPEAEKIGKIIFYLCKGRMVKDAHLVYLSAKENDRYPPLSSINFLINSLSDRKNKDASSSVHLALEMLKDFSGVETRKYAIKPFSRVISGLCRINDFEAAKTLLFTMIDAGPPPGNAVFNSVINSLSKAGDMKEATKVMRLMESRGLMPDVFTYSVIMSGYAKGGEMEEASKILAEAKKHHCKLSPVAYHTIIRGYCKLEKFEEAVKLLGEMKEYGVQPNADEYNKLIQSLCLKAADWGTAEKLLEEMKEKGLHLNGITKGLIRAVKELEEEEMETKEVVGVEA